MCAAVGNGIVAFVCVISTIGGNAADLLVRRDLTEQVGQHWSITDVASGDLDSADLQCFFINPEWILRVNRHPMLPPIGIQTCMPIHNLAPSAPFRAAMLRACHSRSPSMPLLSISRVQRFLGAAVGDVLFKVFWRRLRLLKSGTAQSKPTSLSRFSTNPVVCRSAMPNSTFIEKHI